MAIDGGSAGITHEDDRRLCRAEWTHALPQIREAGATWANSHAMAHASQADFDLIDRNGYARAPVALQCGHAAASSATNHRRPCRVCA